MSEEKMPEPLTGANAVLIVKDGDYVCIGIYNFPEGSDRSSLRNARHLAGVRLQPEAGYEIAQQITRCGIRVEDERKARGDGS